MKAEDGFTLIEFMVSIAAGITVILALFTLIDVSSSNSAQVAARVDANQRAKPVMQRLIDTLHTACLAPDFAPVLAGSGGSAINFQATTGRAVAPVPQKHVVELSGDTLRERIYPATGGEVPTWTFASTPSSDRVLLTDVSAPAGGTQPVFSYYKANAGQLASTPLPTPLSAGDAALAVQVKVAFEVAPSSEPVQDANSSQVLSDAATFRFSPFSEDPTKVNGPCA